MSKVINDETLFTVLYLTYLDKHFYYVVDEALVNTISQVYSEWCAGFYGGALFPDNIATGGIYENLTYDVLESSMKNFIQELF